MSSIKVAIYSRVSTDEQETDNQVIVLDKFATDRGFESVGLYYEKASAWKDGHQQTLARLMTDAARHKFDAVLVWSLDRLSREGSLAILRLIDRLKTYRVKVISYQEPWTEAPGELAELLYAITGWVSRMESERRSERIRAGFERLKAQGKKARETARSTRQTEEKKKKMKMSDFFYKFFVLDGKNLNILSLITFF